MAKKFSDLAQQIKAGWGDDARTVYESASLVFEREVQARAVLGHQLKSARAEHGLTQPALAEATGVHQSEISRIESGAANPTVSTLTKLGAALGLSLQLVPQT